VARPHTGHAVTCALSGAPGVTGCWRSAGSLIASVRTLRLVTRLTPMSLLDLIDTLDSDPERRWSLNCGGDLHLAAVEVGLIDRDGRGLTANYVGQLVRDGLVICDSERRVGDEPATWDNTELQNHFGYRPTRQGRELAVARRAERRAQRRHEVLDGRLDLYDYPWLTAQARQALGAQMVVLEDALDREFPAPTIGAAKNLVEAAAKVALERAGRPVNDHADLVPLIKQALEAVGPPVAAGPRGTRSLVRSLAAVVQTLGEIRNEAGDGHGKSTPSTATVHDAHLAAAAAAAIARWLLTRPTAGTTSVSSPTASKADVAAGPA
jgi:hypothetical protein